MLACRPQRISKARRWTPCPIGAQPSIFSISGVAPLLDQPFANPPALFDMDGPCQQPKPQQEARPKLSKPGCSELACCGGGSNAICLSYGSFGGSRWMHVGALLQIRTHPSSSSQLPGCTPHQHHRYHHHHHVSDNVSQPHHSRSA